MKHEEGGSRRQAVAPNAQVKPEPAHRSTRLATTVQGLLRDGLAVAIILAAGYWARELSQQAVPGRSLVAAMILIAAFVAALWVASLGRSA